MINKSLNTFSLDYKYSGIDIIKFICAFLICTIHIAPFPNSNEIFSQINFWFQNYICRVAVPLYFVSSGFLLFRKMDVCRIDNNRVRNYCFKILRLLGTWSFLLFVGGSWQLWYLGAVVLSIILLIVFLKRGFSINVIILISVFGYLVGLLGDSYYFLTQCLKNFFIPKIIILSYETIFVTTRNGFFFGLIFVLMGVLFAQKQIVLDKKVAIGGLAISMILMFFEVYMLRTFFNVNGLHSLISLLPVVFFLFYIVTHINSVFNNIYVRLRIIGVMIYFTHFLVNFFVVLLIELTKEKIGLDLEIYHYILTLGLTTLLSILVERLSKKEYFRWLKYLYS